MADQAIGNHFLIELVYEQLNIFTGLYIMHKDTKLLIWRELLLTESPFLLPDSILLYLPGASMTCRSIQLPPLSRSWAIP